jgi:hypothetical protein
MRLLVCLGFFLAATAANAQSATSIKSDGNTITITGPTATTTITRVSHSPNGSTYTTTIRRNGGYQPAGLGGYRPMGARGYRPMGY